uniref:Uncharacterized protein n=1 Tax=Colobus angolensis palliatus TaxID=336983 RepID=A0A2K5JY38_COLAP
MSSFMKSNRCRRKKDIKIWVIVTLAPLRTSENVHTNKTFMRASWHSFIHLLFIHFQHIRDELFFNVLAKYQALVANATGISAIMQLLWTKDRRY